MKSLRMRLAAYGLAAFCGAAVAQGATQPDILLVAIDDLNDWTGCLGGHPQASTPNLDKLAARGTLFANAQCEAPVDYLSVYPTVADLAGLPIPKHVEGPSLRPLLENPDAPWNHVGICTHGRGNHGVRDRHWRYIRYADGSEELYDHRADPYEWANLAADPKHADVKKRLADRLPRTEAPACATTLRLPDDWRGRNLTATCACPEKPEFPLAAGCLQPDVERGLLRIETPPFETALIVYIRPKPKG